LRRRVVQSAQAVEDVTLPGLTEDFGRAVAVAKRKRGRFSGVRGAGW